MESTKKIVFFFNLHRTYWQVHAFESYMNEYQTVHCTECLKNHSLAVNTNVCFGCIFHHTLWTPPMLLGRADHTVQLSKALLLLSAAHW